MPAACNSTTTINGIEMKFGLVVRNDEVINLLLLNWLMTSSFNHNGVITVKILGFLRNLPDQK